MTAPTYYYQTDSVEGNSPRNTCRQLTAFEFSESVRIARGTLALEDATPLTAPTAKRARPEITTDSVNAHLRAELATATDPKYRTTLQALLDKRGVDLRDGETRAREAMIQRMRDIK